ncbi:carboxylate--amine ligase [Nonomuraea endophytica]|uniref:Putative ATP-grasp superfamily ATP-dependent carboligase n=1 Tax=Nonomuraea endophytica TaxID=714136 RepID=A0A7W8ABI2_9ACTN|nr:ATP-grasp domain-containing protein [Nonomuraea endophytica]MBB5082086.1 putative ATP-grasp superfamily ATP-dependent carboligase [Nonomuraea endophytica]
MDRNPFHHGTLAAIRSLGRMGVEVHAVLEGPHGPAAQSKYLSSCGHWDPAPTAAESFLRTMLSAADRIGGNPVLLPMDDITAIYTAQHAQDLSPRFRISNPAGELPAQLADKHALATICAHLGVAHPDTHVAETQDDLRFAERAYGFPMMAKWARPWLAAGARGLRSTTLLQSHDQLSALAARAPEQDSELLLQRYIPPTRDADWFFHGYFREDSTCDFAGSGRKERAYPPAAGITTLGRWLPNPEIDHTARTLAKSLRYAGILDMDFRFDIRDGKYYLLDFNPRVGAQFRLFGDSNRIDVIRAAYLDLTGQVSNFGSPQYGRTYLVENYDLLRKLARKPSGNGRRRPGWLSSLRRADELAWYARDDVKPFTGMVKQTFLRAMRACTPTIERMP